MTVSVKAPTSTTGSIQLNGSDVLTIESDRSVDIDSNTLHVDATNNRVGVGTSSPSQTFHVVNGTSSGGLIQYDGKSNAEFGLKIQSNISGGNFESDFANGGTALLDLYANSAVTSGGDLLVARTQSATPVLLVKANGSVGIGTSSFYGLNEKLALYGTSTANNPTIISDKAAAGTVSSNHVLFSNANGYVGSITTLNSGTAFNTSSDYRLKENVAPMSGSIDRLKQLKPSTWSWVQDGSHGEGFLAHEAQSVVPEAVSGTKDAMRTEEYEVTPAVEATYDEEGNELTPAVKAVMGTREVPDYQGIDQAKLVPLLTAALQEAITKIENLETRIEALEAK